MVLMRTASGRLCHINNSRRAAYGYDQRIEVLGAKGRLTAANHAATTVELADGQAVKTDKPLHFFLERYAGSYKAELDAFIEAVTTKQSMPAAVDDARQALVIAEAALLSSREGRAVKVSEVGGGGR
jgi:myo-inositol 2-dehydrogenase/D-chiro-inositol 1-dehydrogenase